MFSHLWQYLAEFFFEEETFRIKVVEKIETYFMSCTFFSENRAVYENMSKSMVEPERPQMPIWRRVIYNLRSTHQSSSYLSSNRFPLQYSVFTFFPILNRNSVCTIHQSFTGNLCKSASRSNQGGVIQVARKEMWLRNLDLKTWRQETILKRSYASV